VRAVGAFAVAGFRRHSAYRLSVAAGAFTNSVFGLLRASIVVAAVGTAGGTLAGYDERSVVAYAWVTQALIAPVAVFTWNDLGLRVRTGDVAVDLARPVDLQVQYLAADLGRAAYVVLPRGLPPMLVGALTFGLVMPATPLPYLLGAASLVLAVVISFNLRFLANLSAFWLLDHRGVVGVYVAVSNILSGMYAPVSWFPDWMGAVARLTPFPSMIQAPADVLTGRLDTAGSLRTLGVQLLWLVVTLAVTRLALARATRRLVVQGG
jgi:ABC-2 type transport system permease protein